MEDRKPNLDELELTIIPFGKHKDQTLDQIELRYLDWLVGQEWFQKKFKKLYKNVCDYLAHPTISKLLDEELNKIQDKEDEVDEDR